VTINLKVTDLDSHRMCIRVDQGKGQKDRYTLLSPRLLGELRAYWKVYRPAVWLFPNQNGAYHISRMTAWRIFRVLPMSPRETRFSMAYSHPYMNPMTWRPIMKIETPLHTDHQLDQLADQFEHWRRTRSHPSERIPQRLWEQAAALARGLPYSRVAQHVRVSPSDLKKHLAAPHDSTSAASSTPPPFVEVPPAPACFPATQAQLFMEIELERPDGARLRLRCPESTSPVTALVRAFLEVS
jgi:hypothetical protein